MEKSICLYLNCEGCLPCHRFSFAGNNYVIATLSYLSYYSVFTFLYRLFLFCFFLFVIKFHHISFSFSLSLMCQLTLNKKLFYCNTSLSSHMFHVFIYYFPILFTHFTLIAFALISLLFVFF